MLDRCEHSDIYMTIHLDLLAPVQHLILGFQQDILDPVKAVRLIQKFTWSMAKLKLLLDNAIENHTIPTQLNKLLNSVEDTDGKYTRV